MEMYNLPQHIDPNKIFIINRSELEGRLDTEYYKTDIRSLENKIRAESKKKLSDFILRISSGATPSVQEEEKFYSDKENGIPFLRVQNLQTNGRISLEDVKYINDETHENYLKRSQVSGGNLLVKITGVGRMAIASVAPDSFVGNTNQHMVVIKTESKNTSEYLANYLNLDVIEKLASRRSTGATRPALDYLALKSIPIIEGIDFSILETAYKQKQQKEKQAQALLASIDDYLLEELGIKMLTENNIDEIVSYQGFELNKHNPLVKNGRLFLTGFREIGGGRFDPFYHLKHFNDSIKVLEKSCANLLKIKDVIDFLESGSRPIGGASNIREGVLSLGGEHVNTNCEIEVKNVRYISFDFHEKIKNTETKKHDILLVKDGATTGKIGIIEDESHVNQNINEHVFLIRVSNFINPHYFAYILHSQIIQNQIKRGITGATVTGLTKDVVNNLKIPIISIVKQNEIALHISEIRTKAKELQTEATKILEAAKEKIEQMILE